MRHDSVVELIQGKSGKEFEPDLSVGSKFQGLWKNGVKSKNVTVYGEIKRSSSEYNLLHFFSFFKY